MVPSSSEYIRRRMVAIIVVTGVIATVLVSSLTRNAPGLSVAQAIAGLGMISASIFFAIARDSGGYWFYAIRAGKVFDPNPSFPGDAQDSTWQGALIRNPWMAAVVGFEFAALICLLADALFPGHLVLFAWCYTIVLLPAATVGFSLLAARAGAQDALRILSGKHAIAQSQHRAAQLVAADLFIAIATNFALVLPVRHKPAYSLEHGYGYAPFVVAFVVLLLIVCAFMLCFAARSRRATLVGELLMGKADGQFASLAGPSRWLALSRLRRYALYVVSTVVWAVLVCAAFAKWAPSWGFVPLYCVALVPLVLMYALERCAAMRRDLAEAQDAERRVVMTFSYEKLPGLIEERMT
ncbi:hypothetical protein ACFSHT_14090 [Paraburkholderia silviterrae]|uniref:Uncharacterized protein n=1 Tax=Paraburkholderia silviterrae TaxID=2528715 RepID=A0A4R5LXW7_9BURK|nr:hypothetical protein [Paraburkholderia silviterrae]TDG17132.1 hypothetical protein EYW47_39060 [Paraburkholderia silviterrae]